jgi:tetratricopeptide (TPR) repeat protein
MDGKVLLEAWENPKAPEYIESWDNLPGDFGEHPPHQREDTYASAEALKQLVELGYIEDPGEDKTQGMEKTVRESRYNLSRVWASKRMYREAIEELKNLVEQCPDDLRFNHDLANALINTGDYSGARECLERLRASEYHNLPTLDLLEGVIMLNEGRTREALALFEEVESKESRLPELPLQLGKIYLQEHRYEEARRAFTKAVEMDENSAASHLGAGIALLRLGEPETAVDHLLHCIGLIYHYPVAHYHLGEALLRLGKPEEAAQAFELCLTMAPRMIKARRFLIKIYKEFLQEGEKAQIHQEILNQRMRGNIIIVSGLPRSGTSMMMQMLAAGGMEIYTDDQRQSDENNPKGYFEAEDVKRLAADASFLTGATDKAVKIVAPLLKFLPNDFEYHIVFMERELEEVLRSQQKMLGKEGVFNPSVMEAFRKELEKVEAWAIAQPNVKMLRVPYAETVEKPLEAAHKVADFLPYPVDAEKMAGMVSPALYRNKS